MFQMTQQVRAVWVKKAVSTRCCLISELPSNFILNISRNPMVVLSKRCLFCVLRTHRFSGLHFPLLFTLLLLTMDRSWTSGPRRLPANHELGKAWHSETLVLWWDLEVDWPCRGHLRGSGVWLLHIRPSEEVWVMWKRAERTYIYFVVCCHGDNYLRKHRVHKLL